MIGTTISHYRVLEKLGEGGMGVVYKAEDLKLDRPVALKLLPAHLLGNEDIRKRFEREAKSAASLDHPNVCHVYEIDEADGQTFIAMSLVEGESLDKKIARGPLKLEEALSIAQQIAKGLEAAHRRGIVHRDIKPENIMVGADGHVTIMDFGLAQLTEASRLTKTDETVGTVAYMSPEQTEGSGTDQRTDIWSLGVVLYEMVTGQQPFKGDYDKAVMYSILNEEPEPITGLRTGVPIELEFIVAKCLEKDRTQRYQHTEELAVDLGGLTSRLGSGNSRVVVPQPATTNASTALAADRPSPSTWRHMLPWALAAACVLVVGIWWLGSPEGRVTVTPVHMQVVLPDGINLAVDTEHPVLALSPDGSRLVFAGDDRGTRRLYMRELATPEARPIEGTEGAASPFFSPDGEWIAFFAGGALKKVRSDGGVPIEIHACTPTTVNRGAAWVSNENVVIAVSLNSGLALGRVSGERKRAMAELTWLTDETEPYAWPASLTDEFVLFTDSSAGGHSDPKVATLSIETGEIEPLINGATSARHSSATGEILFARSASLYAVPFDPDRNEVLESQSKLVDGLMIDASGAAQFAVAGTTLAYVAGEAISAEDQLVWVDREGRVETLLDNGRRLITGPRLSSDGRTVVVASREGANLDLWTLDLSRSIFTRLTSHPGEDFGPLWSPDGKSLAFASEIGEDSEEIGPAMAWIPRPGQAPEPLLRVPGIGNWEFPSSWSPDGQWIAFTAMKGGSSVDVYVLPVGSPPKPVAFRKTPATETAGMFSPDGQWMAYVSDESGRHEVYVRPFPGPGAATQISAEGGAEPLWSRDGKELFYWKGNRFMVVQFESLDPLDPSSPRVLFEGRFERAPLGFGSSNPNYDVSLDGSRFLMIRRKNPVTATVIEVVLNWPEALSTD